MRLIQLNDLLKHKQYTYESYIEEHGHKPPDYVPQMPQKFWAGASPDTVINYAYLDTTDQTKEPKLQFYTLPNYIYNFTNIPDERWAVTPTGKNPMVIQPPLKEDAVKKFQDGIYVAKWKMGILEIWDTTTTPDDQPLPVNYNTVDRAVIYRTQNELINLSKLSTDNFRKIMDELNEIEISIKNLINGTNRS